MGRMRNADPQLNASRCKQLARCQDCLQAGISPGSPANLSTGQSGQLWRIKLAAGKPDCPLFCMEMEMSERTIPRYGEACKHGQLARSCEICELEQNLASMTADRDSWEAQSDERAKDCVMFIEQHDALKTRVAELEDEVARLYAERNATFSMSKCECGTSEACANLVRLSDQRDELLEALLEISQVACSMSPEQKIANKALASVKAKS
jgi:uncharacterized small protein (DUF1192 family)